MTRIIIIINNVERTTFDIKLCNQIILKDHAIFMKPD